jgi:hypothetical protein
MTIYKFTRLTVPPTLEKQREALEAFRTLASQDDEAIRQRRAEIAAIRRDLDDLRRFIDAFRRQATEEVRTEILKELKAQKYSPDQPRVPAGSPHGGEWTNGDIDASSQTTAGPAGNIHSQVQLRPVVNQTPINDPRVISDVTPDNTWVPGAQYAAGWEHHWVPWGAFGKYKLQPETRRVFVDATSGPLGDNTINRWSLEHKAYNEAVDEAFKSFLKRNNIPIDQTERLTPAQAEEFLDEIYLSVDPRIRNFNKKIRLQAFRYWMRYGPGRRGGGEE